MSDAVASGGWLAGLKEHRFSVACSAPVKPAEQSKDAKKPAAEEEKDGTDESFVEVKGAETPDKGGSGPAAKEHAISTATALEQLRRLVREPISSDTHFCHLLLCVSPLRTGPRRELSPITRVTYCDFEEGNFALPESEAPGAGLEEYVIYGINEWAESHSEPLI
jgi:hypothetical protein